MAALLQPYKEGDIVRISAPIPCKLFYGTVKDSTFYNETLPTGTDRRYEIVTVVPLRPERTSLSPSDPIPQQYAYRLVSWLRKERPRFDTVVDFEMPTRIKHSSLAPKDSQGVPSSRFLEMYSHAINIDKNYPYQIRHDELTLKKGDQVMINSPPTTATGGTHKELSLDKAHYKVRPIRQHRHYDLFWKSVEYVSHSQIVGLYTT